MRDISLNITSGGRWTDLRRLLSSVKDYPLHIQVALTQDVEVPQDLQKFALSAVCKDASSARNLLWKSTPTPYAVFLDEDCEVLSPFYFEQVRHQLLKQNPQNNEAPNLRIAVGGIYISSSDQSLTQKSYNFVTQLWTLRNSHSSVLFLGGHFALYQPISEKQKIFDVDAGFGGEEFSLLKNLRNQNFKIQWAPELKVIHHPSPSWSHFFKRAYLHSKNQAHPAQVQRSYWAVFRSALKKQSLAVALTGISYLFLVYFFRLLRVSLTKAAINISKLRPEAFADRTKSSVGSKLGFALASKKNK